MPAQRSFVRADEEYKLLPEAESHDYDSEQAAAPTPAATRGVSSSTLRLLKIGLASQTVVILALLAVVYRSIHPQAEKCTWDSQVLYCSSLFACQVYAYTDSPTRTQRQRKM